MFRGCHRLAYSLACVFCILSILFLDTCVVSASSSGTASNIWNMVDSTLIIDESYVTLNFTGFVEPTSVVSEIGSGTYSGSSSQSGTIDNPVDSFSAAVNSGTINTSVSITESGTTSSGTVGGSYRGSGSGWANGVYSGTLTGTYGGLNSSLSSSGSESGNISLSGSTDGSAIMHYHIPVSMYFDAYENSRMILGDYYLFIPGLDYGQVSLGTLKNLVLTDFKGNILQSRQSFSFNDSNRHGAFYMGSELLTASNYVYGVDCYIDFDLYISDLTQYSSFEFSLGFSPRLRHVKSEFQSYAGSNVTSDPITHQLQEESNSLQEDNNEIAQDTNSKVTNFFNSFFDNLLHIFVPEDGYFSQWFNRVNTLLSDKLGMLYAPFDLVISTLQAIYSADNTETGIPFPGIQWEDTWLIEPFTFTFASLGNAFDDLRDKVYFATDTVLVLTFLMLLQSKVKLILEGHE